MMAMDEEAQTQGAIGKCRFSTVIMGIKDEDNRNTIGAFQRYSRNITKFLCISNDVRKHHVELPKRDRKGQRKMQSSLKKMQVYFIMIDKADQCINNHH